jgi:hypothetical protein
MSPNHAAEDLYDIIMARKKGRAGKWKLTGKLVVDAIRTGNALPPGKLGSYRANLAPQQSSGNLFPEGADGLPPGLISAQGVSCHDELVPGRCSTAARSA